MASRNPLASWLRGLLGDSNLGGALLAALAIRFLLLPWFSDPYNFWGSHLATDLLFRGVDPFIVYSTDARLRVLTPWGYPTIYFLVTSGAYLLAAGNPFLYGVWLRVPSVLLDGATSLLLYRIGRRLGGSADASRLAALAFLLNPFSFITTSVWGVNDPIAVFFTVLAVYLYLGGTERSSRWAMWAVGLGIATKLYPVLLLPVLLAKERSLRAALGKGLLALVPAAVTSAPFLLSDAPAYLGTLLHITGGISGAQPGLLDPQFTPLWLVVNVLGPLSSAVAYGAVAVLLVAVVWIVRRTRAGRLDVVAASGLVLVLAYLFAVRWSSNYFLWILPFAALVGALRATGRARWILWGFWVPSSAFWLIYNGWYPDLYSGGSGLPYWAIIGGGPQVNLWAFLPASLSIPLVVLVVAGAVLAALLFLDPAFLDRLPRRARADEARPLPGEWGRPPIRWPESRALVVVILVAFVGTTAFVTVRHAAVTPLDFGSFSAEPNGNYTFADEFRGDILSFQWMFIGDGRYALHPNGTSGILIDTYTDTGVAYLERLLETRSVRFQMTLRLAAKYGSQPLVLFSDPTVSASVFEDRNGTRLMDLYDAIANRSYPLGPAPSGWTELTYAASPAGRVITLLNTTVSLDPLTTVPWLRIGQVTPGSRHGGSFVVARASLEWAGGAPQPNLLLPLGVVGLNVAAIGVFLQPIVAARRGTMKPKGP